MNCEICGKELGEHHTLKVKIDGTLMTVCENCSKFGTIQKEPPKPKKPVNKIQNNAPRRPPSNYRRRDDLVDELVEDYNILIRESREKKNWSREKLAAEIYEKASVVNRIESGKMTPDTKLIKKLEKTLNIKLLEKYDDMGLEDFKNKSSTGFTLGDMVKIKRK